MLARRGCNALNDPGGGRTWVLVFPDPYHGPTGRAKSLRRLGVTLMRPRKFRFPPLRVCYRLTSVLRAAVPEATIDKYRDSRWSEYDVGTPPKSCERRCVNAISEAPAMKLGAKSHFRLGVPRALALHALLYVRARRHGGRGQRHSSKTRS